MSEIYFNILQIEHTMDHVREWAEPKVVNTPLLVGPGTSSIVPEPLGVCAILGAWNFPLSLLIGPL